MFEIERRSNLGPLILAVLVGILSLASSQYARLSPKSVKLDLGKLNVERFTSVFAVPPAEPELTETAYVNNVGLLQPKLADVDEKLTRHFDEWMSGQRKRENADLVNSIRALEPYRVTVDAVADEFSIADQLTVLRLLFMATRHTPEVYDDAFITLCDRLCSVDDGRASTQAAVLRFYHNHDLSHPKQRLITELREFSDNYPDADSGVKLYAIVARELWQAHQTEFAEAVLKQGIRTYAGEPGVSRLVNQMVDQQQSSPLPRRKN